MTLGPIHPAVHRRACELLGMPVKDEAGLLTPLTEAQMWEAAEVERRQILERMVEQHRERWGGGE